MKQWSSLGHRFRKGEFYQFRVLSANSLRFIPEDLFAPSPKRPKSHVRNTSKHKIVVPSVYRAWERLRARRDTIKEDGEANGLSQEEVERQLIELMSKQPWAPPELVPGFVFGDIAKPRNNSRLTLDEMLAGKNAREAKGGVTKAEAETKTDSDTKKEGEKEGGVEETTADSDSKVGGVEE